jgi:predicted phosphodiesterase
VFSIAKRFCAVALSAFFVLGIFQGVGVVSANQSGATVEIKFTGDEADVAGFAQCDITVTPSDSSSQNGYFIVYYTDGNKILPDYDEATAIKMTGGAATGSIGAGMMIPHGAKGIAVFSHTTYFFEDTPDIKDAIATAEIPASKHTPDFGKVQFSFGALSDTHMNYEQHNRGAYAKLKDTMDFMAEKGMDIVVIAGDVVGDRGENPDLEAQYAKHVEIIKSSDFKFEDVYEATGNHGNTPADVKLHSMNLKGDNQVHPYENSPYFYVVFEGENGNKDNVFIFLSMELKASGDTAKYDTFSKEQIDWFEGVLSQYGDESNIFIACHAPFLKDGKKFGAGDIPNGTYNACIDFKAAYPQNMRLKALLEQYKHAVVMSGHTHVSFYDNANYSNVDGTFAHTVHIGSNSQPCAYGGKTAMVRSYDGRRNVTPEYGSEGYTVEVYSDYIVYTGYNFSTDKKIPNACFMIPVKQDEKDPPEESSVPEESSEPESDGTPDGTDAPNSNAVWFWAIACAIALAVIVCGAVIIRKKK